MHEMGKEQVAVNHSQDSQPLKGDKIPTPKMFKRAPGKKGKKKGHTKGKMKGAEKGKMHQKGKKKKKKGRRGPGQKDLVGGMMMKWFKKKLAGKKKGKKKLRKMLKKRLKNKKHLKKKQRHRVTAGRKWHLIKKHNGLCKCTKHPRGRIIVSKHESQNDCENRRNGC